MLRGMEKTITETMMTKSTGRPPIYRIQTGDGCWYRISEEDYRRLNQAKGIGCVQLTVLPGREHHFDELNMQRLQIDDPEALEARVAKAKAEIAALTEKLATAHKLLTDALGGRK
jgi:hypothetical protein